MRDYIQYSGLSSVCLGVLFLLIEYIIPAGSNAMLMIGLSLIIAGIIAHTVREKRKSKY